MDELCDKMADLKIDDDFESFMEVDDDEITETPMGVDDESTDTEKPMEVDDDEVTGTESPMAADEGINDVEIEGIKLLIRADIVISVHHRVTGVTGRAMLFDSEVHCETSVVASQHIILPGATPRWVQSAMVA